MHMCILILCSNLLSYHFEHLFPNQLAILIQDNAVYRTAKRVQDDLEQEGVEVHEWPTQGPNLNPIENFCKIIVDICREQQSSTVADL